MPWMVCPCCALWSLRSTWVGIGPGFPFQTACPACGVASDNRSAYISHAHPRACIELGLKHLTTRPYRPRTNGKAERFIQTLTRSWARGRLYANSVERTAALNAWLNHYNFTRPHISLGHQPPASRLTKAPRSYS